MLALSALYLHRFLQRQDLLNAYIFFLLLAAIVLTRSVFHLVWFLFYAFVILLYQRQNLLKLAPPVILAFALIFSWYAKNLYLFGSFSSSSFFGMSLSKLTTFGLPEAERKALVQAGKLSQLALIEPFSGLDKYASVLPTLPKTNIPVLDRQMKDGPPKSWNYNSVEYLHLSKQYLTDALRALVYRPQAYILSVLRAYVIFFRPAGNYPHLAENLRKIEPINRFYTLIFLGQFIDTSRDLGSEKMREYSAKDTVRAIFKTCLFLALGFLIVVVYGFHLAVKALSRKPVDYPFALTLVYLCTNILYVMVVGNCFEVGENFRFRFMVDPFLIVLLGIFLTSIQKRFAKEAATEYT
jgi:hypothetical protein